MSGGAGIAVSTPSGAPCWRVIARIGDKAFDPIIVARSEAEAFAKAERIAAGVADPALPWTDRWAQGRSWRYYANPGFTALYAAPICAPSAHRSETHRANQRLGRLA